MDVLRFRSSYPTILHPFDYYRFKKNFQPKLAPPRKKPAYSSLHGPGKNSEDFGLTINPPTICLNHGCCFTFLDGVWVRSTKKGAVTKDRRAKSRASGSGGKCRPPRRFSSADSPRCPEERNRDLEHCRKAMTEQCDREKQEMEDFYENKLACLKDNHEHQLQQMQQRYENEIARLNAQIDALTQRNNELKGENNLLLIKVSKMMDMLADCAAEASSHEETLLKVTSHLAQSAKTRPFCGNETEDDYVDDCCG